jgi:hypothetical protein
VNSFQPHSVQVNLMSLDGLAFHVKATVTKGKLGGVDGKVIEEQ